MKYRGLTYNREKESYEWVYGLPSYGYATDEVAEIGTVYGDFKEIFPDTLGEQTPYRDKNGKEIYTGDIVALEVDGQIREFVVDKATVDREYNTLPNFEGDTVKVRLADVVICLNGFWVERIRCRAFFRRIGTGIKQCKHQCKYDGVNIPKGRTCSRSIRV